MNTFLRLFGVLVIALFMGACAGKEPLESYDRSPPSQSEDNGFSDRYVIILEGLSGDQASEMEEMLESMPGYQSLRPRTDVDNGPRYREYWLSTVLEKARLRRNLRKALKRLNVKGNVDSSGRTMTVTKTGNN